MDNIKIDLTLNGSFLDDGSHHRLRTAQEYYKENLIQKRRPTGIGFFDAMFEHGTISKTMFLHITNNRLYRRCKYDLGFDKYLIAQYKFFGRAAKTIPKQYLEEHEPYPVCIRCGGKKFKSLKDLCTDCGYEMWEESTLGVKSFQSV